MGDWVLAVNSSNVRHMSHDRVVTMVKDTGDEVTIEITTPT